MNSVMAKTIKKKATFLIEKELSFINKNHNLTTLIAFYKGHISEKVLIGFSLGTTKYLDDYKKGLV